MKRLRSYWSNLAIRYKLLAAFFSVIIFVSAFNLYLNDVNYRMLDQFSETMTDYYQINELMELVVSNQENMDAYMRTADQDILMEYNRTDRLMSSKISQLFIRLDSQEAYFALKSIRNSVETYREMWDQAIRLKQSGVSNYYESYYHGVDIYRFTQGYVQELLYIRLGEGDALYNDLSQEAALMRRISTFLILGVFLLAMFFAAFFALRLVRPIKRLADASIEMAEGNLDVAVVTIESNDEVGVLAESFNAMSASIKDYVEDLKQKVVIEKKLHEEEIAIIKMEHLLQSAEFQALQSQVNPHFLFNTLNTISRTAMFEKADDTVKLIQALSKLLRYRIRSSEDMVTLDEELSLIHEYVFLQKMRFKERLEYDIKGQTLSSQLRIPVFTLQPIVENAIIHGIEPKIEGGRLRIKVRVTDKKTTISVIDTGVGIDRNKLSHIIDESRLKKAQRIGVANVYNRFKLHYGGRGHFKMYSREGVGTIVRLVIDRRGSNGIG